MNPPQHWIDPSVTPTETLWHRFRMFTGCLGILFIFMLAVTIPAVRENERVKQEAYEKLLKLESVVRYPKYEH
jgi:hypothetical protein